MAEGWEDVGKECRVGGETGAGAKVVPGAAEKSGKTWAPGTSGHMAGCSTSRSMGRSEERMEKVAWCQMEGRGSREARCRCPANLHIRHSRYSAKCEVPLSSQGPRSERPPSTNIYRMDQHRK